jgi:hypothetical protein
VYVIPTPLGVDTVTVPVEGGASGLGDCSRRRKELRIRLVLVIEFPTSLAVGVIV